jgi:hypothetical protein
VMMRTGKDGRAMLKVAPGRYTVYTTTDMQADAASEEQNIDVEPFGSLSLSLTLGK